MNNSTLIDRLIEHYSSPDKFPLTPQLEIYEKRLDFCRDCLKRHSVNLTMQLLLRKFKTAEKGYSRATAYNDIRDTRHFFSLEFNKADKAFEIAMSIERLTRYREEAEATAKTPKDWQAVADIEDQINKLKGLHQPEKAQDEPPVQTIVQVLLPTRGRTKMLDPIKDTVSQDVIDLVENDEYSVEDMKKQILSLDGTDREGD